MTRAARAVLAAVAAICVACSARSPLPSAESIRIESVSSYWSGVFGDEAMDGTGIDAPEIRTERGELFVISGVLRNTSAVPLRAAHLAFELVDADGRVVHRQDGYNYGAERLLDASTDPDPAVVPIPPGEQDRYRMILFGSELPPFERATVRAIAAEPVERSAPAASPPRP